MPSYCAVMPDERRLAFDPARPLELSGLRSLCGQTGARIDDALWLEVLTETGRLADITHPLHRTLLLRLAEDLRRAGYAGAAARIGKAGGGGEDSAC